MAQRQLHQTAQIWRRSRKVAAETFDALVVIVTRRHPPDHLKPQKTDQAANQQQTHPTHHPKPQPRPATPNRQNKTRRKRRWWQGQNANHQRRIDSTNLRAIVTLAVVAVYPSTDRQPKHQVEQSKSD